MIVEYLNQKECIISFLRYWVWNILKFVKIQHFSVQKNYTLNISYKISFDCIKFSPKFDQPNRVFESRSLFRQINI